MRTIALLFISALTVFAGDTIVVVNPVSGGMVTRALVSQWRFEGSGDTLIDSAAANDGQLGSSAGADANDPDWGAAGLDFPNVGDRVELSGLTFDPSAGAWSVSVVGAYDTSESFGVWAWSQQDGTGTGRGILGVDAATDQPMTFLGGSQANSGQTLSTGYHHITITYNGSGTISWYVDGGSATTASIAPESATGNHWIGSNKPASASWSNILAWAWYYSDDLTEAENNKNCGYVANVLAARSISLVCN